MTQAEQRKFICELVNNVRAEMVAKVGDMPDYWNGIELRQYIADKFAQCVIKSTMDRKRRRDYENTCIVHNL